MRPDLSSGAAGIFGLEYAFSFSSAIATSANWESVATGNNMAATLDESDSQFLRGVGFPRLIDKALISTNNVTNSGSNTLMMRWMAKCEVWVSITFRDFTHGNAPALAAEDRGEKMLILISYLQYLYIHNV